MMSMICNKKGGIRSYLNIAIHPISWGRVATEVTYGPASRSCSSTDIPDDDTGLKWTFNSARGEDFRRRMPPASTRSLSSRQVDPVQPPN